MRAKRLWYKWKELATKIAVFQSKVILTVFYFILLGPVAIIAKLGSDPLKLKNTSSSTRWEEREEENFLPETLKKQF
jgi:hypothetical protein